MPSTQRPRAIIIGGSLGGLFNAICLRKIGWDVQVFERSPQELDSRGGGLVLQPGVTEALRFADASPGDDFGVPSHDRIFVERDGTARRVYLPQTQIAWNGLYLRLRQALDPSTVHSGETFTAFAQDQDRVTAQFASGASIQGDLLIGAGGPASTLREQLLAHQQPHYAGYAAWRGVLPEQALSERSDALLKNVFAFQDGPHHQFLSYRIPGEDGSVRVGERRQNWVWYRKIAKGKALDALLRDRNDHVHSHSLPPGSMRDAEIQSLTAAAREHLAPTLADLVTATPDPFVQLIQDFEAPNMVFGRVVLTGDAAFVARPHTGAGAGKAAADALNLAQALQASPTDLHRGLALWENARLPENQQLVRYGVALGRQIMGS